MILEEHASIVKPARQVKLKFLPSFEKVIVALANAVVYKRAVVIIA